MDERADIAVTDDSLHEALAECQTTGQKTGRYKESYRDISLKEIY